MADLYDMSGLLGGAPPPQGGLLATPPQMAQAAYQPPRAPGVNPVLGFLDNLLFNGAAQKAQQAGYASKAQNAQQQYQYQALSAYAAQLPPQERSLFLSDPKGYLDSQEFNRKQMDVAGGHSVYRQGAPNGGGVYTAPLVGYDQNRGVGTSVGGTGALSVGTAPGVEQSATTDAAGNITDYTGHRVGTAPIPQKLGPTDRMEYSGGASGTGVIGGPPSGAPMLTPQPGTGTAPRGVRNNNYTNLTALPGGQQWAGQTGVDKGGYVQFASPQDGINAAVKNLHTYATAHGINTVAGLVQRWAPAGAGNNTAAYTSFVAKQLGVDPNAKIDLTDPATTQKVIGALASFENGPKAFAKGGPAPDLAASAPKLGGSAAFDPNNPAGIPSAVTLGAPVKTPGMGTQRIGASGLPEPTPGSLTRADVVSLRDKYMNDEKGPYQSAQNVLNPMKSVFQAIDSMSPNGVVQMGLNDALNKAFNPGGVIRASTMRLTLEHFGVPAEAIGHIENATGNGFMSPGTVQKMGRTLWLYGKTHADQANTRAQQDGQYVTKSGFGADDLGEPTVSMPPVPAWAQDPKPLKPVVGKTYWTPRGPMKYTAKGYAAQ